MDCINYSSTYFDKEFAADDKLFNLKKIYEQSLAAEEARLGHALSDEEQGQVLQTIFRRLDEKMQKGLSIYLNMAPELRRIYNSSKLDNCFDALKDLTKGRKRYKSKIEALDKFLELQTQSSNYDIFNEGFAEAATLSDNKLRASIKKYNPRLPNLDGMTRQQLMHYYNYFNFKQGLEALAEDSDERLRKSIKEHDPLLPNVDKMTRQQLIEYANYVNNLYKDVNDKKDPDVQERIMHNVNESKESIKTLKEVVNVEKKRMNKEERRNAFFNNLGVPHLARPVENRTSKVVAEALRLGRLAPGLVKKDYLNLGVSPDDLRNAGMSDEELRAFGLIH